MALCHRLTSYWKNMKKCSVCGAEKNESDFYVRGGNRLGKLYSHCKLCYHRAQRRCRQKQKRALVNEFGGKCSVCGYSKSIYALEFHHLDKSTKNFPVSDIWRRGIEAARIEAKKCTLLCSNCHREIEEAEMILI